MKVLFVFLLVFSAGGFAQADMNSVCEKKSNSAASDWNKKRAEHMLVMPFSSGALADLSAPIADNKEAIRIYKKCIASEMEKEVERITDVSCQTLVRKDMPELQIKVCTSVAKQKEEIYEKAEELIETYMEKKSSAEENASRQQATYRQKVLASSFYVSCEGDLIEDENAMEKAYLVNMAGAYERCDVVTDEEYFNAKEKRSGEKLKN